MSSLHRRRWPTVRPEVVIGVLAIAMGWLFVATYRLSLGDPVPHRIDAALVGDPARQASTVDAVQQVADDSLVFRRYASVPAALHAIDDQDVYAALDLTSSRPTLYVGALQGPPSRAC